MDIREDFSDIINMPHHVSDRYPHMSMQNRAAQFAPFAALAGFDEKIDETDYSAEKYFNYIEKDAPAD